MGSLKTSISNEGIPNVVETKKKPNVKVVKAEDKFFEDILRNYLRLDVQLAPLYEDWARKDPVFKEAAQKFYGIRMLNQEPVENLFSFICSQNNHISRLANILCFPAAKLITFQG